MPQHSEKRSLAIILSVFLFVGVGTYVVTLLARGYRPSITHNGGVSLNATGLLSVTSKPKAASVYLDGSLITATDDTINLSPGKYLLKIVKDGFLPWQKNIQLKKEVVYQSDAQLFRSSPDLRPITLAGAINPTISQDFGKIIFAVASASAVSDNGLYLVELSGSPLSLNKNIPRQIATNFPGIDWSKAVFLFSPDTQQILATFNNLNQSFLLNLGSNITQHSLTDVTAQLSIIKTEWQSQDTQLLQTKIDRLPKEIQPLVSTNSSQSISYSTAEDKVLYLAAANGQIPTNIIAPPPAQSTQPQIRNIIKNNYYIYDFKDDTNYLLGSFDAVKHPFWLPKSTNIVYVDLSHIIMAADYDTTNKVPLFAGNFNPEIIYPSAEGDKIITLTSAYTGAPENLYAVTIR